MIKPTPEPSFISQALKTLFAPGDIVEIRALHKTRRRTDAGYFDGDNRAELVNAAVNLNKTGAAVYVTLNTIDPQLLGRYANRIEEYAKTTATDNNVTRRRWLLIDIDPMRPKDTAATDQQLELAKITGRDVYRFLKNEDWPSPVIAASGNGMHLLYRLDLPNDNESRDAVKGALDTLAERFDTEAVTVDRSVYNAGRIIKLYGTVSTKGDHTPVAPWRLSQIISTPENIDTVSLEQLRALFPAVTTTKPTATRTTVTQFDLEDFLDRQGIPYTEDRHDGRDRYRLDYCPFNSEHGKGESAIFQDDSGVLGFKCLHNTCADKSWHAVRELIDGPRPTHTPHREETVQGEPGGRIIDRLKRGSDIKVLDIVIEWLLHGIIPKGAVTLFFGRGGLGKSTLALLLFGAIAAARQVFGMQATQTPVVYIDFENSLAILKERLSHINADDVLFLDSTSNPPKLDKPERGQYLEILETYPGAVFIFDTLRSGQSGDENDSKVMADVMGFLRTLRDRGATVIVLHHTPKSNDRKYKGSGAIFDMVDHVLAIYPVKQAGDDTEVDDDDEEAVYRFGTALKTRYEPFKMFLKFDHESRCFEPAPDPAEEQLETLAEIIRNIGDNAKQGDIIEAARAEGISQKKALTLLHRGEGQRWESRRGDKNAKLYNTKSCLAVLQPYIGGKNRKTESSYANHYEKQGSESTSQSPIETEFGCFSKPFYQTAKQINDDDLFFEEASDAR
jgi:archaellum biogenesis ATPase FlaH